MITDGRKTRDRRAICRVIPETACFFFHFCEAGRLESWGGAHLENGCRRGAARSRLHPIFFSSTDMKSFRFFFIGISRLFVGCQIIFVSRYLLVSPGSSPHQRRHGDRKRYKFQTRCRVKGTLVIKRKQAPQKSQVKGRRS